ncbi:MAG TPA: RlmE family RNA methyltransferase [Caulobacteraceae bacterium]|nr:RlmE family RNA methyltransferase [Caulobacteraceae bacterium]
MTDEDPPEPPRKRMVRAPTGGEASGRNAAVRVKTAKRRTPSSQAWLARQLNDPFVTAAKAQGYRARAAFKLTEIDDRFGVIRPGARVIDLGCAPGGWLQVAVRRKARAIAGVDLLPVEPVAGAHILQMDFTDPACAPRLLELLGGPPDVVLSDMAPNTVGHRITDHLRIAGLIEAAIDFALEALTPGGAFVAKAFQGGQTDEILARLRRHFVQARYVKPKASRTDSSETFLVATGFKGRQPDR